MVYSEQQLNLWDIFFKKDYYFAQCISADLRMGLGVSLTFNQAFNTRTNLLMKYGSLLGRWDINNGAEGIVVLDSRVFNLVTKRNYWDKPTLDSMDRCLRTLRNEVEANYVHNLAMPKIGCGLDNLKWEDVSKLIIKNFQNTPVKITVCYL